MADATDAQLRILADKARGDFARQNGGKFFAEAAYTAALRAVYAKGREDQAKEKG